MYKNKICLKLWHILKSIIDYFDEYHSVIQHRIIDLWERMKKREKISHKIFNSWMSFVSPLGYYHFISCTCVSVFWYDQINLSCIQELPPVILLLLQWPIPLLLPVNCHIHVHIDIHIVIFSCLIPVEFIKKLIL